MKGNEMSKESTRADSTPDRVKFDYIKSNLFRNVHADGVVGGLTPRLDVHLAVWSQRSPIPRQVVHEVEADGTVGEEIKDERDTRDALVREVEVGVILDEAIVRELVKWLQERIDEIENARKRLESSRECTT